MRLEVQKDDDLQQALLSAAAQLRSFRGMFLGDGLRAALDGYRLAELLEKAGDKLSSAGQAQPATQAMVAAADLRVTDESKALIVESSKLGKEAS